MFYSIIIKSQDRAVLVSSKVTVQTKEGYDRVLQALHNIIINAPGFIMQTAYPAADGWWVMEVRNPKAEADKWFAKYVVSNIPSGVHPNVLTRNCITLLHLSFFQV